MALVGKNIFRQRNTLLSDPLFYPLARIPALFPDDLTKWRFRKIAQCAGNPATVEIG